MPSWLLLASPHCWLERDDKAGFNRLFEPQIELFIKELEKAERNLPPPEEPDEKPMCLSALMRESWSSGRFWFNYAMRSSIDADVVYWKALHDGENVESLDQTEEETEFIETKMEQFDAYMEQKGNDPRFR